jgi:transcriptional regulator with XRE-family HTH domain
LNNEQIIKAALSYKGMKQEELAAALGTTTSNFNQKLKKDTLKKEDLEKIAAALGASYSACFIFPDGTKIGA